MPRSTKSSSPTPKEIANHYNSGYEKQRMSIDVGKLARERSRELLTRFLPPAPAKIRDVGGGPGGHACWLAKKGYEVHLIDIIPLHIEQAKKASEAQPETPLASVEVGDACSLNWKQHILWLLLQTRDGVMPFKSRLIQNCKGELIELF